MKWSTTPATVGIPNASLPMNFLFSSNFLCLQRFLFVVGVRSNALDVLE